MWSFTIGLLLLSASSTYGGMVGENKPYESGKDLLSLKGASEAIKRSFKEAGSELEDLAEDLKQEVDEIAKLSAYLNHTETEEMSEALAEAKDIQTVSRFNLIFPLHFIVLFSS